MAAESDGGVLWRTLSREEDLLESVLLQLDPASLVSIELVCRNFRHFMQRKHIWKKRFDLVGKYLETPVTDDSESVHIRFKRMSLKLSNLESNLRLGHFKETRAELPAVGYTYNIMSNTTQSYINFFKAKMHPSLVFVRGTLGDLETSLLFDVDSWQMKSLVPPAQPTLEYKIRAVDVTAGLLCLLRSLPTGNGPAAACIVETYSASGEAEYSLASQSQPQDIDSFGFGIKVKLAGEERILVLSFNIFGDLAEPMHARINIFEKDSKIQTLLVITKRVRCYTEGNISNISVVTEEHLVSCAGAEDLVEVWDLRGETDGRAVEMWTKRIVPQDQVVGIELSRRLRISTLEWRPPFLLVGTTGGRVEVWDTGRDGLLRTLDLDRSTFSHPHMGGVECDLRKTVVKVAVQDHTLICLTDAGWLFGWDWCIVSAQGNYADTQKEKDELRPNWTKKLESIMPIMNFVSNSSEILSFEGGTYDNRKTMFLVRRDFLNAVMPTDRNRGYTTNDAADSLLVFYTM